MNTKEHTQNPLQTIKQISAELGVSEKKVRSLIGERKLGCFRIGRRVLVSPGQLQQYLHSVEKPPLDARKIALDLLKLSKQ